jgi:hypothetical protein
MADQRAGLYLIIAGLLFTVGGAVLAARGALINKQTASELAKWTMSEELRRSLIRQSRDAKDGLIFVAVGSALQIGGIVVQLMSGRKKAG